MSRAAGKAVSADGTAIAFERLGDGPPVILVSAALQDRALYRPLAGELAPFFTVFNYDRRGRGESDDTAPYAVEREIEDLRALIQEAGGSAAVYGHSSGAALARILGGIGLPRESVDEMSQDASLVAMAHTLAYDSEVMGDIGTGGTMPTGAARAVTVPALVLCGGESPGWMIGVGGQVADVMPEGRQMILEGQEHFAPPGVLAPVLAEFFEGGTRNA